MKIKVFRAANIALLSSLVSLGVAESCHAASLASAQPPVVYPHRSGALTATEIEMAKIAWRYFQNNYQPETGLVNAVDGYPSTTMWDTASYLAALVTAHRFEFIDKQTFDARLTKLIATLNTIELFRSELPNKVYHTKTAEKVNYANKAGEIGFSALDLGRLLIWLHIIKQLYPEHANAVDSVVLRWNFTNVVDKCGTMYGAMLDANKKTVYVQEGRLGYEEYAAKGFQLWRIPTCLSARPEPFATMPMYCVNVPYDTRDPRELSQHNYVVSESYVLDGIELGWDVVGDMTSSDKVHTDVIMENFAHRVYQVQENRYKETGVITARSEHQLDKAPYFVYDTVYSDGYPWNTITDSGKYVPEFAAVSLKAALGMWVLWDSPYTDLLANHIWHQYVPEKGYYEGVYENGKGPIKTFTANNNGIMLESLLFKKSGKILTLDNNKAPISSLWEKTIADSFNGENKARNRPSYCIDEHTNTTALNNKKSWFKRLWPSSSIDAREILPPAKQCSVQKTCTICQENAPVTLPAWSSCH
ncbi:MAG: DUF3131 domain-containing protein [Moraxellaceae bacterium]|nr:DUF3131 domain-containing protein [Pseudomonadales bacterium]MCP5174718.1 DUF3131 domain-containing protein [Moraxellaceae bacterium]MCP5176528.1 DUF3131 domain-containing protein [Moraxellaceae bacterium]